jgi:hypothetical protein
MTADKKDALPNCPHDNKLMLEWQCFDCDYRTIPLEAPAPLADGGTKKFYKGIISPEAYAEIVHLRAEVERLRGQLAEAEADISRLEKSHLVIAGVPALEWKARADSLLAALREAPHGQDCGYDDEWHSENGKTIYTGTCNCWKTEAAAAIEREGK